MTQPIEGGSAAAPTGGAPAPDAAAAYAAALDTAMNAPTPQARAKAVDALEMLAKQRSGDGAAGASPEAAAAPAEGLEPPSSAMAYTLENSLPPGVEIVDTAGLGALKTALFDIGVPVPIAQGGFTEIAALHSAGAFASDAAYDQQITICKAAMVKTHGENAKSVIADGLAFVDAAVRSGKLPEDVAAQIIAAPMALSAAANLKRFGGRK